MPLILCNRCGTSSRHRSPSLRPRRRRRIALRDDFRVEDSANRHLLRSCGRFHREKSRLSSGARQMFQIDEAVSAGRILPTTLLHVPGDLRCSRDSKRRSRSDNALLNVDSTGEPSETTHYDAETNRTAVECGEEVLVCWLFFFLGGGGLTKSQQA